MQFWVGNNLVYQVYWNEKSIKYTVVNLPRQNKFINHHSPSAPWDNLSMGQSLIPECNKNNFTDPRQLKAPLLPLEMKGFTQESDS